MESSTVRNDGMNQGNDTFRELLLGLLALQTGLIDQRALVSAFHAWTRDKARPLADHLVARGDLDAAHVTLLEGLVVAHLARHGGDLERSLAAIPAGRSTIESLVQVENADASATLTHLGGTPTQAGEEPDHTAAYRVSSVAAVGQRFRVLRPHARGGLGAVFVALDTELNREVALKQILDVHAHDPTSRHRFLIEAEVTGGLEHPGIVPVYGLGSYADGRLYYAMRFIRGESLKEAIDRFHSDEALKKDLARRSLELRKLLRRFMDVCNAIDYAHSRGVLHRDIKPGNIIIGKHGETLVVDWGLAKVKGGEDLEPTEERPLAASSTGGSTETLPGLALGTPAYMSPEQARGELEQLGPRSDIYSLGATLYCLLTGKPPFEGEANDVIPAVQRGALQPPRSRASSIDQALEAVCLKAMALDPAKRYASPKTLGEELERWMAGESVAAYRESWDRKLSRWLTRHRTGVAALGAALLVAVAGLGAVLGVQARANGQLTAKNAELDAEFRRESVIRKEAESNFNMAKKAVDDYLTNVSENTLFQLQDSLDIRRLRQELLKSALKYYETFVNQRSQDPHLRRQLADAYFRVGEITKEVEAPTQAIDAFHAAQAIWEPLATADPGDHELRGHLAQSYLALGRLQNTGLVLDLDGAAKSLARARALLEPLAAENPLEARFQSSLADCYSEIAAVMARKEQSGESLVLLERAKTIEKDLINRYPDRHAYQKTLAEITNVLGYAYYRLGKNDEALNSFREAQTICQSVSKQVSVGPKPLWLLNLLALSHSNIAWIHQYNRQLQDAAKSFEQALVYRTALADAHPSVVEYRAKVGISYRELSEVQRQLRQDAKAFESVERSIDTFQGLVRTQPRNAAYHNALGLSFNQLGLLYDETRKNTEALAIFEHAVAEQQFAIEHGSDAEYGRFNLPTFLDNLAEEYVDLGRVAEGLPIYRRSLKILGDLGAALPNDRDCALAELKSLFRLGTIERHNGNPAAAREGFAAVRTILDRRSVGAPGDPALPILRGAVLDQEASALFDQGFAEEARSCLEQALVLLRAGQGSAASGKETADRRRVDPDVRYVLGIAPDAGDLGAEERRWRSEALWDLARVLRFLKRPDEANKAEDERVALWMDRPSGELVDIVLWQLDRALVIGFGRTPVSDLGRSVRQLDLDQAAANLKLAIAWGFRDLRKLRSHPDADFLLARDDLKLPIMDLALPDWPFGDQ
jgi:serine/threonine-protein kinase